jgi:hypothetical protein
MNMRINKDEEPIPTKLNVDLSQSVPVTCEKCESQVFVEGVMLRRMSKILIGSEQDAIIPIPVFACGICGNINENMRPKI